jgi:hypothetical protein
MATDKKPVVKKKAAARKPAAKKVRDRKLLTAPVCALTVKNLADAGILKERNKQPTEYGVDVELSEKSIQKLAKALELLLRRR